MVAATTAFKPAAVSVGFSQAPYLNEAPQYAKWQRKLKRKLAHMLALPVLMDAPVHKPDNADADWRYVVFLGASTGRAECYKIIFG